MKTLEQRYNGQNVLHSGKTPQEVVKEQFAESCILKPLGEPLRSNQRGVDYCKTWQVMDRDGCEKGEESYVGVNLVEIP